jgi:hypothetical protein
MGFLPVTDIRTSITDPKGRRPDGGVGPSAATTVIRTVVIDPKDRKQLGYWRAQNWGVIAQGIIAFVSVAAVILAGIVAWTSYQTTLHDARTSLRQAQDSQLSAAIDALGAPDSMAERIAGLLLLRRNTEGRFTQASQSGELPGDVYDDYTTALQILSGYLSSRSQAVLTTFPYKTFHRGYGAPAVPGVTSLSDQAIDLYYAADQVRVLLRTDVESMVRALHIHMQPAIDLSNDELYGASWTGVNFSWVYAFMEGIDLRNVDLAAALFQGADLRGAYLQCADLTGALFQGADLRNADLNGADVQGADFRGARIKLPKGPVVVYGTARWSHVPAGLIALPVGGWNQGWCVGKYLVPQSNVK